LEREHFRAGGELQLWAQRCTFSSPFPRPLSTNAVSRKLTYPTLRAVVCGFLYGVAVYMFMSWIIVPLSAFPQSKAPFSLTALTLSLLTHMFCVGLPIALAARRYSR
jgi:hypothetical protein